MSASQTLLRDLSFQTSNSEKPTDSAIRSRTCDLRVTDVSSVHTAPSPPRGPLFEWSHYSGYLVGEVCNEWGHLGPHCTYIAPSYPSVTTSSGAFWIAQTCCMWYSHHKRHPRKLSQMGTRELYMCSVVRDDPIHYSNRDQGVLGSGFSI